MPSSDPFSAAALFLHIGARDDSRALAGPVPDGLRRVLVQPDPGLALALRGAAGPSAEVLELGLAAAGGQAELLQMNFAALNSFHEPTAALRALFPGLKVLRRQSVPVLSPAALLERIGARGQVIDLVLDAPGSELRLLQAWKAADALKQVRKLVVRCGSEVFFDGATDRAGIEHFLAAEGFIRQAEDLTDPDWPVVHWRADPALRALKTAVAESRAVAEAKAKALTEMEARFVELTASAARERAAAEQTLRQLEQEIKQVRSDAGLQIRLQCMHRIDVEDLQRQLRDSEAQRQGMEALLRKLTPRLEQAAQELRDLNAAEIAAPAVGPALAATIDPQPKTLKKARKKKAGSK